MEASCNESALESNRATSAMLSNDENLAHDVDDPQEDSTLMGKNVNSHPNKSLPTQNRRVSEERGQVGEDFKSLENDYTDPKSMECTGNGYPRVPTH